MPIYPCGSVMDYLRSGYSTNLYSFSPLTGGMIPVPITWSRCVTGARPIGIHHQYASSNWTKGVLYQDQVGEIPGPVVYNKGLPVPGLPGNNYCGSRQLYVGKLTQLVTPIGNGVAGQPICCNQNTDVFCRACVGQTGKAHIVALLTGGSGDFAYANGNWILVFGGLCQWTFADATRQIVLSAFSGPFSLTISPTMGGAGTLVYSVPTTYNCHSITPFLTNVLALGTGTVPLARLF